MIDISMRPVCLLMIFDSSLLQCYSVLSDNLVKNKLCILFERGSNVLSTGEGFICLSPPSKLKIAVLFCSVYKKTTGDWDCVAAVERLPALHYSVDFIFLSFGIMGFIVEPRNY